jgi:hypothetical protein
MKKHLQKLSIAIAILASTHSWAQSISTFEDISLAPNSFYNGSDFKGGFKSGSAYFTNMHDTTFGTYWEGFSVSNTKDDSTTGYLNQYSAITGGAKNGDNYGVFYVGGKIILDSTIQNNPISGFFITNSTYTYFDMKNGSQFSKKFGGPTGKDPDYLRVVISAWKNGGMPADTSIKVYLADLTSIDSTKDYILNTWKWVNLGMFGQVDSFAFKMESSDTGTFGINTPRYFCMDNFNLPTVGLTDITPKITMNIYPNPVNDILYIHCNENIEEAITFDMKGNKVMETIGNEISVESLNQGIYVLQVRTIKGLGIQKFIKQ